MGIATATRMRGMRTGGRQQAARCTGFANLETPMNPIDYQWRGPRVTSWAQFHRIVKRPGRALLARLGDYDEPVLVAGCQRSGTTALTRLLHGARGMANFRFCRDDELAAALLLAGQVECAQPGRYCFQTTYLNDRAVEYFDHTDFRLIWIVREPASVVYSMLFNWKRGALRRLYDACGRNSLDRVDASLAVTRRLLGPSRLEMACASYIAKAEQTFLLRRRLGERMLIVDYRDLVLHKETVLPQVFDFAGVELSADLLDRLHGRSIEKATRFPPRTADWIRARCSPIYARMRDLRMGACHA